MCMYKFMSSYHTNLFHSTSTPETPSSHASWPPSSAARPPARCAPPRSAAGLGTAAAAAAPAPDTEGWENGWLVGG